VLSKKDIGLIAEVINDLPLTGTTIPYLTSESQRRSIALQFARAIKAQNPSFDSEAFLDRAVHGIGRKELVNGQPERHSDA
jgi:hypothetical protein